MGEVLLLLAVVAVCLWVRSPRWWGEQIKRLVHSTSAWKVAAVLWVFVLIASILSALPLPLFLAVAVFVPFWIHELRILFAAGDEAFPGRNDKLIWALYLLFCPPVGLIFFRSYRERHWASGKQTTTDWI